MPTPAAAHTAVTDVASVGAGPTGLTAAVRLTRLGIPTVVLDAAATPTQTSKAAPGARSEPGAPRRARCG